MPHRDDIWYVGRARAESAHGDLDGGQRSSEVKWGKGYTPLFMSVKRLPVKVYHNCSP